jgi:hypothetical protein
MEGGHAADEMLAIGEQRRSATRLARDCDEILAGDAAIAALIAAGYRVVRITWRRLTLEPHAIVALLARLLPP